MTGYSVRFFLIVLSGLVCSAGSLAGEWSNAVEVTHNREHCVSYRARLNGSYLAVEATLGPGWHTFAMDNARRASEKLEGKKALSQDQPTKIAVGGGFETAGAWFQTPPKDFSRPALRWFSWGFDDRALFMVKVRRAGDGPVQVGISGQVCTESTCKKVDLSITIAGKPVPESSAAAESDLASLIQVR